MELWGQTDEQKDGLFFESKNEVMIFKERPKRVDLSTTPLVHGTVVLRFITVTKKFPESLNYLLLVRVIV